jgi:predicted Rossmann-fold nucleotide-binding protein
MSARKQLMRTVADCFVCLPGSYGTLDEMMDATSSAIVGEHHKPTYVLNYKGFYNPLKQQIAVMQSLAFIPKQQSYAPVFVDTLEEIYTILTK